MFVCLRYLSAFFLIFASMGYALPQNSENQAKEVITRYAGKNLPVKVKLSLIDKVDKHDVFETQLTDGVLEVKGSSGVALCKGFYDFIKTEKAGIMSWTGKRFAWPNSLKKTEKKRVVSPFQHHYYFNVVTFGYSTPYWDWERWEKEIDWMALHGMDMPLALVANEAISARVWKKLGLTDQEIASYFVGPAHLPWMRMGNISGIDGPLPDDWHTAQIALQHKILNRMKSLGMKPICPGFAGFVPPSIKRVFPEVNLVETKWGSVFKNWMISPDQELFSKIGTLFIQEWEKEFGKNDYYLIDSFNEMEIPFPPKGSKERYALLSSYGDRVYHSLKEANPDAVWVMQGWMFGYQRNIWDQETLASLLEKVPDDKMLLLDLAVDYNKNFWRNGMNWDFYKGFFNKPWVYSVIPNMGGKSGMTGILEFYANGHLEALNSPNKGALQGFGMAPEGIENNEVIYELLSDAGWSSTPINLDDWLKNYNANRYGKEATGMTAVWDQLKQSVYGTFTDHPRFNWQLRPGKVRRGSVNVNEHFYQAAERMAELAPQFKDSPLFLYDFIEMTTHYAGEKLQILSEDIDSAYLLGQTAQAEAWEKEFVRIFMTMDRLLQSHPTLSLERWIKMAKKWGKSTQQQEYYERNARRIVTIWGPPVDDYSARIWSGLIRDYYLPRWQNYFQAKKTGKPFNHADWERNWVEKQSGLTASTPFPDPLQAAINLINGTKKIVSYQKQLDQNREIAGTWSPDMITTEWKNVSWDISAQVLSKLTGVLFAYTKGNNHLEISEVALELDGKIISIDKHYGVTGADSRNNMYKIDVPKGAQGNNSCLIRAKVKSDGSADSMGNVFLIFSPDKKSKL